MKALVDEEKKKANEALVAALITSIEKGEMADEELQKSARYIRYNMNVIASHEEFLLFLHDLADHWPAYKGVFLQFKGENVAKEDTAKMAEIQSKLQAMIANK